MFAYAAVIRPLSEMAPSYFYFVHTRNILEILARNQCGFTPSLKADDLAEATGPVSETEEVPPKVSERLAAVNEAL